MKIEIDLAIVTNAQNGNQDAFTELYRALHGRIQQACLRIMREEDVAEECAQRAFIKAFTKIGTFKGESSFSTWVHAIARNECFQYLRWMESRPALSLNIVSDENDDIGAETNYFAAYVDPSAHSTEVRHDLNKVLTLLPPQYRTVLWLRLKDHNSIEIAQILGLPVGTIKSIMSRSIKRARKLLKSPESARQFYVRHVAASRRRSLLKKAAAAM